MISAKKCRNKWKEMTSAERLWAEEEAKKTESPEKPKESKRKKKNRVKAKRYIKKIDDLLKIEPENSFLLSVKDYIQRDMQRYPTQRQCEAVCSIEKTLMVKKRHQVIVKAFKPQGDEGDSVASPSHSRVT